MSNWTHINASIRIDDLFVLKEQTLQEILDDLPAGSEGQLEYQLWTNPHINHATKHTLNIFGDLRNFNDDNYIEEWFNKLCSRFYFRGAILEIDNTSNAFVIIIHNLWKGRGKISTRKFLRENDISDEDYKELINISDPEE